MKHLLRTLIQGCVLGIVMPVVLGVSGLAANPDKWDRKDVEKLFTERAFDFYDISLNCSRLVAELYSRDEYDSVRAILNYWEKEIGEWEPITRARLLLAIDLGEYSDSLFSENTIPSMMNFRYFARLSGPSNPSGQGVNHPSFDTVMQRIAYRLSATEDPGSLTQLVTSFYAGNVDSLFPALQEHRYATTALGRLYDAYAHNVRYREYEYFSLVSGGWFPVGSRSILGQHPTLGFQVGADFHGYCAQVTFVYSFLNSPHHYVVNEKGTTDTTREFGLWYAGLDFGKELKRTMRHQWHFLLGLGAQGLNAVTDEDESKRRQLASGILTVGLGYRYYFKPYGGVFLAVEPRYELSRFNTHGGTDLSGSAFTLRVSLAFGSAKFNNRGGLLEALQYRF